MPKMFNWAKKISGCSSAKHTGQKPETSKDASSEKPQTPEKKSKLDKSFFNTVSHRISGAERRHYSVGQSYADKTNSEKGDHSEMQRSSDRKSSLLKRHNSDSRPSHETGLQSSPKKTSSFTKRLASFRFSSLDRDSSSKRSRSKSKSPQMATAAGKATLENGSQNESPSHLKTSTCSKNNVASETTDQNIRVNSSSKVNGEKVILNGSKIGNSSTEEHPSVASDQITREEESSASPLPKTCERRSISEKLYGEVIKEFDKRRTTKLRLSSSDVCEVCEGNEPGSSDIQIENFGNAKTRNENSGNPKTQIKNSGNGESRNVDSGKTENRNKISENAEPRTKTENTETRNENSGNAKTRNVNSGNTETRTLNSGNTETRTENPGNTETRNENFEKSKTQNGNSQCLSNNTERIKETRSKQCLNNNDPVQTSSRTGIPEIPVARISLNNKRLIEKVSQKGSCEEQLHNDNKRCDSIKPLQTPSESPNTMNRVEDTSRAANEVSPTPLVPKSSDITFENMSTVKTEPPLSAPGATTMESSKDNHTTIQVPLSVMSKSPELSQNDLSTEKGQVPQDSSSGDPKRDSKSVSIVESRIPPNNLPVPDTNCSSRDTHITAIPASEQTNQVPPLLLSNPPENTGNLSVHPRGDLYISEEESPSLSTRDSSIPLNGKDKSHSLSSPSQNSQELALVTDAPALSIPPSVSNSIHEQQPLSKTTESISDSLFPEISDIEKDLSAAAPGLFREMLKLSDDNEPSLQESSEISSPDENLESPEKSSLRELIITEHLQMNHISSCDNKEKETSVNATSENKASMNEADHKENPQLIPQSSTSHDLQVCAEITNETVQGETAKEKTGSSSNELTYNDMTINQQNQVHTDPKVSCYNLEESSNTFKSPLTTSSIKEPIPSPRSVNNTKKDSNINDKEKTPPKPSPRHHFENVHRSNEEVSSQSTYTSGLKGSRGKTEISETLTESGGYISSGEGGSLPASPSVPRRKRKSHLVPGAGSLQTLSVTGSSEKLPLRKVSVGDMERPRTPNHAPPRPPPPTSTSSPSHISSSSTSSSYSNEVTASRTSSSSNSTDVTVQRALASNSNEVIAQRSSSQMVPIPSQETPKSVQKAPLPEPRKTESLNPFDIEDDEEPNQETQAMKMQPHQPARKISLNPFGSDDEDDDQTNISNQHKNTKSQLSSAGYNPFDEDDDNETGEDSIFQNVDKRKDANTSFETVKQQSIVQPPKPPRTFESLNPFDEDEDDKEDTRYNDNYITRDAVGRQSLAVRGSSPFQREGVRASLPCSGRGRSSKKRQAPLPPGYKPSPTTTPQLLRNTGMRHGQSSTSLYWSPTMRKDSITTGSSLSLSSSSSPKRPAPPRPPPPRMKSVSMAQL